MLYNVLVSSVQQIWINHKVAICFLPLNFSLTPPCPTPSRLSQSTRLCYTVALKLNFCCIWWLNVIFSDFFSIVESFWGQIKNENLCRTPIYKLFQFIQNLFYPHPLLFIGPFVPNHHPFRSDFLKASVVLLNRVYRRILWIENEPLFPPWKDAWVNLVTLLLGHYFQ